MTDIDKKEKPFKVVEILWRVPTLPNGDDLVASLLVGHSLVKNTEVEGRLEAIHIHEEKLLLDLREGPGDCCATKNVNIEAN